jgi:tripartite-type tricarboxylate transporter receptor subunit TctC
MRLLTRFFAALIAGTATFSAIAQGAGDYPNKPVTLVVPFAAGGPTDVVGRMVAQELSKRLGQSVIVANRPGAGGNTGSASVAAAAPDGYTLLLGTVSTHGINPSLYEKMPYDHKKDFVAISQVGFVPSVLVVNNALPVKTVPELIAYLKQNPGKVFYASPGAGTSIHLASEMFKMMSGTEMTHVPYKGSAPAMQDVIGGQVPMMFDNTLTAWPQVQSGRVRALAVTTPQRLKSMPDVPAMSEFLPGFSASAWHGLFAPARTPRPIVDKLAAAMSEAMKDQAVAAQLMKNDVIPVGNTPAQFATFINEETDRWAGVIRKLGLKAE